MDARIMNFRIVVSDIERSLAFYTGLLGFKEAARVEFSNPDVTEIFLDDPSGAFGFVLIQSDVMPVPSSPGWGPFIMRVEDVQAFRDEIKDAGYELVFEPISVGPMNILMVADPDGYLVEVMSGDAEGPVLPPLGEKIPYPVPQIFNRK
jgi:catechol 2,3-dioxygenase-like lactoylglutathione lyase family enzyme